MKYALKKLRRIILVDIATKKHLATIDDLKNIEWTDGQETIYAEGSDGARLAAFDINKVSTLKASNGSVDVDLLALQVGSEVKKVENGSAVLFREEFDVTDDSMADVTLNHTASGATGNEVRYIYKGDANGSPGDAYPQAAVASATEFAYDPATNKITLPTGAFHTGDVVIIDYFPAFTTYDELQNDTDKFSISCEVYVDAFFTDLCSELDVPLQIHLSKGKVSGNRDLAFGDQAAVQNVEIEALTQACRGSSKNLWTLRKYDEQDIVG